jgi:lipopolysaccharide transport system ATP-binding protein
MSIAVRAEQLGKAYQIGVGGGRSATYGTLRDQIASAVAAPFRALRGDRSQRLQMETVWALDNISFEISHGETVGIIGRNGAGKSTLLKVLSRITEPSRGRAVIYGRVGSLLEVGTGFHPELTGRENIFLNGAILGMRRAEIVRKFDEIVAFAEIEKFIDTPVKFYSSGMYVRLAFAVAAHMEPEILIVDEVLAVGDVRFQKKCLNKMQDVGQEGRTVLFVSHSMSAITRLCQRAILLDQGTVLADGPSQQVAGAYLSAGQGTMAERSWSLEEAPGGAYARMLAVRICTEAGEVSDVIDIRRPVALEMEYEVTQPDRQFLPHFHVFNEEGIRVFITVDQDPVWRQRRRPPGRYVSRAWIPGNMLAEGTFLVDPVLMTLSPNEEQFSMPDCVAFQVVDSHDGDSARGDWTGRMLGVMRPLLRWETPVSPLGASAALADEDARG